VLKNDDDIGFLLDACRRFILRIWVNSVTLRTKHAKISTYWNRKL